MAAHAAVSVSIATKARRRWLVSAAGKCDTRCNSSYQNLTPNITTNILRCEDLLPHYSKSNPHPAVSYHYETPIVQPHRSASHSACSALRHGSARAQGHRQTQTNRAQPDGIIGRDRAAHSGRDLQELDGDKRDQGFCRSLPAAPATGRTVSRGRQTHRRGKPFCRLHRGQGAGQAEPAIDRRCVENPRSGWLRGSTAGHARQGAPLPQVDHS